MLIHTVFDLLAACAALGMTLFVYNWRLKAAGQKIDSAGPLYGVALLAGAAIGGFGAGTLNLFLSGEPGFGRSIVGALAGAIAAVEIFKRLRGISGSTGLIFVPALLIDIAWATRAHSGQNAGPGPIARAIAACRQTPHALRFMTITFVLTCIVSFEPSFIALPLPNARSICASAASSELTSSTVAAASADDNAALARCVLRLDSSSRALSRAGCESAEM